MKKVRQAGAEPVERAVLADDVVVERGIRRIEGNAPGDVAVERLAQAGNIAFVEMLCVGEDVEFEIGPARQHLFDEREELVLVERRLAEIGRASWRDRGCKYV